jgi:hypothetical protein
MTAAAEPAVGRPIVSTGLTAAGPMIKRWFASVVSACGSLSPEPNPLYLHVRACVRALRLFVLYIVCACGRELVERAWVRPRHVFVRHVEM